jgi:formate/nitrite transporter
MDVTVDAYAPAAMRQRVSAAAAAKAATPLPRTFALAVLAGSFIALGAIGSFVALTGTDGLGFGLQRFFAGAVFSVGLALVVVAGAELFTGDNLMVMGVVDGKVGVGALVRTWAVVAAGNAAGSVAMAALWAMARPAAPVVTTLLASAHAKAALDAPTAFARAILCNLLVCLAVWAVFSCRSTGEKLLVVMLPVATFVAAGFEHSVANVFVFAAAGFLGDVDVPGALRNLAVVTVGNLAGGAGLVAGVYAWVYGPAPAPPPSAP